MSNHADLLNHDASAPPGSPADPSGSADATIDRLRARVAELERELTHRIDPGHAERFLDSIVDNIPFMIFVKDAHDLRFVRVNKAEETMLGLWRQKLLGHNDYDLFPREEADFFTGKDRSVLKSGQLLDIPEEPIQCPLGLLWLHTKKIPLLDEHGEPQYLLGISEDITQRKMAEEELREKNRLLEESVRAERAALDALREAQGKLVQSEKLAALGELVAGVAHEINNPLAFVTNNVVVLQRDFAELKAIVDLYRSIHPAIAACEPAVAQQVQDRADHIDLPYVLENIGETLARSRDGLKRIQQIVRDLREFSRQEQAGDRQEGADLNAGVASTVNIVRGRARSKRVEIDVDLGDLPGVTCCPTKINQVVLNLLANAVDASPQEGRVAVRTRRAPGGEGVEIVVSDSGHGIDPAVRDKIFDPFFTTKPQGHGTGLGLSISHGIIAEHGGTISVESEAGKGATFSIRLPLAPPEKLEC